MIRSRAVCVALFLVLLVLSSTHGMSDVACTRRVWPQWNSWRRYAADYVFPNDDADLSEIPELDDPLGLCILPLVTSFAALEENGKWSLDDANARFKRLHADQYPVKEVVDQSWLAEAAYLRYAIMNDNRAVRDAQDVPFSASGLSPFYPALDIVPLNRLTLNKEFCSSSKQCKGSSLPWESVAQSPDIAEVGNDSAWADYQPLMLSLTFPDLVKAALASQKLFMLPNKWGDDKRTKTMAHFIEEYRKNFLEHLSIASPEGGSGSAWGNYRTLLTLRAQKENQELPQSCIMRAVLDLYRLLDVLRSDRVVAFIGSITGEQFSCASQRLQSKNHTYISFKQGGPAWRMAQIRKSMQDPLQLTDPLWEGSTFDQT